MTAQELRFSLEQLTLLGRVGDFYALLRAIDEAIPRDATLYLEGTSIASDVKAFLRSPPAPDPRTVEPGTLYPKPEAYHLPLADANLSELRAIAERFAEPDVADHLVVYRSQEVLLWAHDAGSGYVFVAASLPTASIESLQAILGDALE